VVNALLKDGKYKVRGVGRARDEKKFNDLRNRGVEMIKANVATGEGLDEALNNAYATFVVTHSFDSEITKNEYQIACRLIEKAKHHGVKILVWSTLPHAQKLSNGKYEVPHFTEKAKVEEHIRKIQQSKEPFETAICISPAFYYQNFHWKGFAPKKDEHGCHVFVFPKIETLSACDINDLGPLFVKLLENPHQYNNKTILLEGENAPPSYYVQKFQEITNQKATLKEITLEEFQKSPNLHSKELAEMFAFINEFTYFGKDRKQPHLMDAREIYPHVKNWETYLHETGWKGECHP